MFFVSCERPAGWWWCRNPVRLLSPACFVDPEPSDPFQPRSSRPSSSAHLSLADQEPETVTVRQCLLWDSIIRHQQSILPHFRLAGLFSERPNYETCTSAEPVCVFEPNPAWELKQTDRQITHSLFSVRYETLSHTPLCSLCSFCLWL